MAFEREKYYSPSEGKTYLGPLPAGYEGYRFGPGGVSGELVRNTGSYDLANWGFLQVSYGF